MGYYKGEFGGNGASLSCIWENEELMTVFGRTGYFRGGFGEEMKGYRERVGGNEELKGRLRGSGAFQRWTWGK